LKKLQGQKTEGLFTFSIVVVDNDHEMSAKSIVSKMKQESSISIDYYVEPEQNIPLARNKAVENAEGDYVAFIDDDEFPVNNWLFNLYQTINKFKVAGVLGPVRPHFGKETPQWIIKGKLYERPSHKTGMILKWGNTRTGNVLLRKNIFNESEHRFNPILLTGEDKEFFKRMIDKGYILVWCDEAPVYEMIPPERMKRAFMLRRALFRGKIFVSHPSFNIIHIFKSVIAISIYTLALPFLFLLGHHIFMKYLIKDFDHIGRILAFLGLDIIKQKYVIE
jgi:glycosyltransferase involved in cell wall biosynthesis